MPEPANQSDHRGTVLTVAFTFLGAGFILFFLFISCGGWALEILAVTGGIAVFGLIHYLLWGRSFNQEVAGEREETVIPQATEELPDPVEAKEWTPEERSWYKRF